MNRTRHSNRPSDYLPRPSSGHLALAVVVPRGVLLGLSLESLTGSDTWLLAPVDVDAERSQVVQK